MSRSHEIFNTPTLNEQSLSERKKKKLKNALGLEYFSPEQSQDDTIKHKIWEFNNNKVLFSRPIIIIFTVSNIIS